MKFLLPCLLGILLTLAAGCQSTSSSNTTWRRPGYFGGPKKSVAVVVLAYRPAVRAEYENALAAALRARGVRAVATYPLIPTPSVVSDKENATARLKSLGVDGVLGLRLADKKTLEIVRIAPSNSGEPLRPWQGWFDFFGAKSAFATSPTDVQPGKAIGIHAVFFENPSGTLLWSGNATPTVGASTSKPETFANAVTTALQRAALIP